MTFNECIGEIRMAYRSLGHTRGWRFLYSPQATYSPSTPLLLLGLNPGGRDHGGEIESVESGNAYRPEIEVWNDKGKPTTLQRQVGLLFGILSPLFGDSPATLMDRTMSANIIPFRSPSFLNLTRREASIAFSITLWKKILMHVKPSITLCIGHMSFNWILDMSVSSGYGVDSFTTWETGWSKVKTKVAYMSLGCNVRLVIGLPHLSRFAVFGRNTASSQLGTNIMHAVEKQILS